MRPLGVGLAALVLLAGIGQTRAGIFEADFDDDTVGQPPAGWTERYFDKDGTTYSRAAADYFGVTMYVDNTQSVSAPNSLHVWDKSFDFLAGELTYTFDPTSVVTLLYSMRNANDLYEGAGIALLGDSPKPNNDFGLDWYSLKFGGHQGDGQPGYIGVQHADGGGYWVQPTLLPCQLDTWYDVRHTVNCVTKQISYEVWQRDDPSNYARYRAGFFPPFDDPAYSNTYVNRIRISTTNDHGSDTYFDNISITNAAVPEPSTLAIWSLLATLGITVGWWRKRRDPT